ncbi:MAG: SIR2 family protein [Nocardioidaceae bacterium]
MLLGDVQIPESLLSAQEAGRLVIFTGAGISVAEPSGLPGFLGLTKLIASTVKSELDPDTVDWRDKLDTFMGVLDDDDAVDVHQLVRGIVSTPASLPNANHRALAQIASTSTARVVTTNYDLHLEAALSEVGTTHNVYRAPALPLGQDFDGLVYLHGTADDIPRHLIITDRDFGRAYLRDAWAARFLERMFSSYTVLFVGYSHTDIVMKYLGLGLGRNSERYALTTNPRDPIWRRLRVTAIGYTKGEAHEGLTKCLTAWAELGDMGLLEHRQRIKDLVSEPADPTPSELSYLQESIQRDDRVRFFTEFARDKYWLLWANQQKVFQGLFNRSNAGGDVTDQLAIWFASVFAVGDEDVSDEAWTVLAERGGVLGTSAWNAVGRELHAYNGERPARVRRWMQLLIEQEHTGCVTDFLDYAFDWVDLAEDPELVLDLLAHLMSPKVVASPGFRTANLEVETRGGIHWLDDAWQKVFFPALDRVAIDILTVAEGALRRHFRLQAKVRNSKHDSFNYRRKSIRHDHEHTYRQPIDAIIDAARDSLDAMWEQDVAYANLVVSRWIASPYPLLRRLAVHAVATSPATPDFRVALVLAHALTTDRATEPETFHLLGFAAKDADSGLVDQLVIAYAPTSDELPDQYRAFTALEWLERNGVMNTSLTTALDAIRTAHPDFTPEAFPGQKMGVQFSWVAPNPPLSPAEFDDLLIGDPAEAVAFILSFEDGYLPQSGKPSREDAIATLSETVQLRAGAGLRLWPELAQHPQLQAAVMGAWGHATDSEDLEAILDTLLGANLHGQLPEMGQFFLHAARAPDAHWEQFEGTGNLMDRVWDACATEEEFESGNDWATDTINTTVGLLFDFWFEWFRRRWAAAGDGWQGLPDSDRLFLERALTDHTKRGAHALTQIAGRLHFLDAADTSWCRQALLPLGDWSNPDIATPFWWGVLSFARWNSGLVDDGLLGGLIETSRHLTQFGDDQVRRWAGFVGSIAVRCESTSAATWVQTLAATAREGDRIHWIEAVQHELEDLDENGRTAVWNDWLAAFWLSRTQSHPYVLNHAEATAFATLTPFVPPTQFSAAVDLVTAKPAGLTTRSDLVRDMSEDLITSQHTEVGRFLTHLMLHTATPFYGGYTLRPLLEKLITMPGDSDALREAALRLGIKLPDL